MDKYIKGFGAFITLVFLIFCVLTKTFASALKLDVVYPKEGQKINAKKTFFIGSTTPGAKLSINGQPVKVFPSGSFVRVFDLKKGPNEIKLHSVLNGEEKDLILNVSTAEPLKTIPHKPTKIDETSIKPRGDIYYKPGDTLTVKFRGSRGYRAYFLIGKKQIPMKELPSSITGIKGVYKGKYVIQKNDNFKNATLSVRLKSKYAKLTRKTGTTISVIPPEKYILGEVTTEKAPVRTFPYGGRLTPIPKGTLLVIDGKFKEHYRFNQGNIRKVWINEKDVNLISEAEEELTSKITSVNIIDNPKNIMIKIPLEQRLPLSLNEKSNKLIIDIYGGKSDLSTIPQSKSKFVNNIRWTQPYSKVFRLSTSLNFPILNGYDSFYLGNDLIIKINKPPVVNKLNPLKGRIIAIDPGHGADELGAVGPTGVPEKTVNLRISEYLKQELERAGAKVIMTRVTDDENPDLYERPVIATKNNAEVLVSVHNNALPDGKNPYKEHGSSVYYYHSQAKPLASEIQNSLVRDLKFNDLGVFWGSLVLTRPTNPVCVLVEVGFMINPYEYEKLITPEYQKKSAVAIKKGLENYFRKISK